MEISMKWAAAFTLTGMLLTAAILPVEAATFKDVPETAEYYDAVERLVSTSALSTTTGQFNPRKELTRGQAAKILAIVFSLDVEPVTMSTFSDVKATAEFAPYIEALTKQGIINGYADGTFRANHKLTRGQMAKILSSVLQLPDGDVHQGIFRDVAPSHNFAPHIYALYAANITKGKDDGTFGINETVKRSQFALFVNRAIEYSWDALQSYYFWAEGSAYAVNVKDGTVIRPTLDKSSGFFKLMLPDDALYLLKLYEDGEMYEERLLKIPGNLDYENVHMVLEKAEGEYLAVGGGVKIPNLIWANERYELVDGNAANVQFIPTTDAFNVIITKTGIYHLRVVGPDTGVLYIY